MTPLQKLILKAIEESSEFIHGASKVNIHGLHAVNPHEGITNYEYMICEFYQLKAYVDLIEELIGNDDNLIELKYINYNEKLEKAKSIIRPTNDQ